MGKNLRWWGALGLLGVALGLGVLWSRTMRDWAVQDPHLPNVGIPTELTPTGPRALVAAVSDTERSAFWGTDSAQGFESIEEVAASVKWFEAEQPVRSNFPKRHAFMPESETESAILSGGNWLGTDNSHVGQFAEYTLSLAHSGTYSFYARKFWRHGPFRYRFDGGSWVDVSENVYLMDEQPLRKHVVANWITLPPVTLAAGEHTLRIELTQSGKPAAFDAFVLAGKNFVPRGKLKPGETAVSDHADWFVFDPGISHEATPLDYPITNAPAGEHGYLQASNGKLRFADEDAHVRFWGVNSSHDILDAPSVVHEQYARHLAKWGVNLVRLHGSFASENLARVDQRKLSQLFSLHSALRRQGIYLALSIYFPIWHQLSTNDGFAGYDKQHPFALPFFNDRFAKLQQGWWHDLLTTPSPVGNRRLVDEPSLAFVELVNEDSTLFWTFSPYDSVPAPQMAVIERRFWDWLEAQAEDIPALIRSGKPVQGDDPAPRRIGIMPLSEVLQRRDRRAQRTAFFLADVMRQYYATQVQFLRQLGYQALTVCSNWHTADEVHLGPLDNWANLACDVMDRHGYFSGVHTGDSAAYAIETGHEYADRSLLQLHREQAHDDETPRASLPPFLEPRFNNKPSMTSELGWPMPNRFRGEGPLLTAAYGALHDLDAVAWFAVGKASWPRFLNKFEAGGPAGVGQFAAAARIFRQALVDEAKPVAHVSVPRRALTQLQGVPLEVVPLLDELRQQGLPRTQSGKTETHAVDAMWLLTGPIDLHLQDQLTGNARVSVDMDHAVGDTPWRAGQAATITSRTEQLNWDFATGTITLAAPKAQFAIGFVSRLGRITLPDFEIESTNEYAQVALVTLDGKPLRTSESMLLSVGTETRNAEFRAPPHSASPSQRRIDAVGRSPVLMRKVQGRVHLRRSLDAMQITPLDANGTPLADPRAAKPSIPLLPDVPYYHLNVQH